MHVLDYCRFYPLFDTPVSLGCDRAFEPAATSESVVQKAAVPIGSDTPENAIGIIIIIIIVLVVLATFLHPGSSGSPSRVGEFDKEHRRIGGNGQSPVRTSRTTASSTARIARRAAVEAVEQARELGVFPQTGEHGLAQTRRGVTAELLRELLVDVLLEELALVLAAADRVEDLLAQRGVGGLAQGVLALSASRATDVGGKTSVARLARPAAADAVDVARTRRLRTSGALDVHDAIIAALAGEPRPHTGILAPMESAVITAPTITVTCPDGSTMRVPCRDGMVIGRSPDCDLALPDTLRTVSRQHARLIRRGDDRWMIEDLGSRNKLIINGQKVDRAVLREGEPVTVGLYHLRLAMPRPAERSSAKTMMSTHALTTANLDAPELSDLTRGQADGPDSVDGRHLRVLERFIEELPQATSPDEVHRRACELTCRHLGARACLLLNVDDRAAMRVGVIASYERTVPGIEPGQVSISRTLIESVLRERVPMLASTRGTSADVMLSSPGWDLGAVVAATPVALNDEGTQMMYVVFATTSPRRELADFLALLAKQIRLADAAARHRVMQEQMAADRRERALARQVQARLTSPPEVLAGSIRVETTYRPCGEVGGDYADAWMLDDGRLACIVADVCGKGLPAALIMSNTQAAMHASLAACASLSQAVDQVNNLLLRNTQDGTFVTAACLLIDPETGAFELVNAGHPPPLRRRATGEVEAIGAESRHFPMGLMETQYSAVHGELGRGEVLLLCTDGVTETMNADADMIGVEGVRLWLAGTGISGHDEDLPRRLAEHCATFRGDRPPEDDLTVMALRRP